MRNIFLIFLLIVMPYFLFSQTNNHDESNQLFGSKVWLKSQSHEYSGFSQSLNFNQPIDFSQKSPIELSRSVRKKKVTFYMVLQSQDNQNVSILNITDKDKSIKFTNQYIQNENEIFEHSGNLSEGILMKHEVWIQKGFRQNFIQFDYESISNSNGKTKVMEFIYIPEILPLEKQEIIESYLSIKYGISLEKGKNYYSLKGQKIWDNNENYNYRVTGIGREDALSLNQKQSGNSQQDGLTIGVGSIKQNVDQNTNSLPNQSYIIWGDNNQKTIIKDKKGLQTYHKMDRVWKLQSNGIQPKDSVKISVLIDPKKMILKDAKIQIPSTHEEHYWLVVNEGNHKNIDYLTAKYYKQNTVKDFIVFDDIKVKPSQVFTVIKAPDFFTTFEVNTASCNPNNSNAIKGKIIHGQAPFQIQVKGLKINKTIQSSTPEFEVSNLTFGTYTVIVTDHKKQSYNTNIVIEPFSNYEFELPSNYQITQEQPVVISPNTTGKDFSQLDYTWLCENKVISKDIQIETNVAGNYKLKIITKQGCEKILPFRITNEHTVIPGLWHIIPNPVKQGEIYTISVGLDEPSQVSILLFGKNGNLVANRRLGKIQRAELQSYMNLPVGEYLLQVSINGNASTKKMIVE